VYGWPTVTLDVTTTINAFYIVVAALIAHGAVSGKVTAAQGVLLTFLCVMFATANRKIGEMLGVIDAGGLAHTHLFGSCEWLWLLCLLLRAMLMTE
jgi:hypothetical protein